MIEELFEKGSAFRLASEQKQIAFNEESVN